MSHKTHDSVRKFTSGLLLFVLTLSILGFGALHVSAATLTSVSIGLEDSQPSATGVAYTLTASGFSTGQTIGCIEVDLGTAADGTGAISGLNTGSSTFTSQAITATGTWTVQNTASADQKLRLVNSTPVVPQSGARTAIWDGIQNGNTANTSYYAVITTYTTNTCTTPSDSATVQIIYTSGQTVSMTVDGSLSFSVAGVTGNNSLTANSAVITNALATTATTIPFGTVTSGSNKIAAQDLTVGTNAGNGYTVYTRYTAPPTAGSFTISPLGTHSNTTPGAFSAAGTEAFGYTTEDSTLGTGTADRFTSSGGNKWAPFTTGNAEIIYNSAGIASQTTRVGFQTGIATTTEPGAYTTTVIYTATPVY